MVGKIFHLGCRRAGIGRHRDGAELGAGEPGQHGLDTVIEMDQHELAGLDAARRKARRQRADALEELAIIPDPRRRVERRPGQKGMIAPRLAAHPQQPRHIETCEGAYRARRL